MTKTTGTLFLMPNALDFGTGEASSDLADRLPIGALRIAARLEHWLCENAKTTRAFLKRVEAMCPLALALQQISIVELPRPPKGRAEPATFDAHGLLAPLLAGHDLGLLSEAGLPAVADPGALVVAAAHAAQVRVVALPGASSITLAIAASGLNGQSFAFLGYLPIDAEERNARIRELEAMSRRHKQTQVTIETPYRNAALLAALVVQLQPTTMLSVSIGLTLASEATRSDPVSRWRSSPGAVPADVPAVFSFLAR
jgi:16S rRNA (cytidine1402-2'-O)-methyltransferase